MLTVVIPALNRAPELQGLLAALVPAAVDGLVRQVIVVGLGSTDETAGICEDAGAELVADFGEAARRARYDKVLVLPVEMRLKPGWDTVLGGRLARGGQPAVLGGLRESWFKAPKAGVLAGRDDLAGAGDFTALRRKARGARL